MFSGFMMDIPGKRLAKYKRRWFYFPEQDKLFLSVTLLSKTEMLCTAFDGVMVYQPKDSKKVYFDSDWLCEEYPEKETTPGLIKLKAKIKKECLGWVEFDKKKEQNEIYEI